jgi:hypothetical protein
MSGLFIPGLGPGYRLTVEDAPAKTDVEAVDDTGLPQTGVIGFKSTGSATRHTSTQDRPASNVSLLYYDRHNDLSAESRHDRPCHA